MDIVIKTGQAQDNLKKLRTEIRDLKSNLIGLDSTSQEYASTLVELANKTRDLKDLNEMVNASAMDLGQVLGNVQKGATQMASGISAANAALNLFGGENEATAEALKKVQSAIQLIQGLQGMEGMYKTGQKLSNFLKGYKLQLEATRTATRNATTAAAGLTTAEGAQTVATKGATVAQKGLNAAMKANPVGLIMVAVTALVGVFALLKDKISALIGENEQLSETSNKVKEVIAGVVNVIKNTALAPINMLITYIKTLVNTVKHLVDLDFSGAWDAIENGAREAADVAKNAIDIVGSYQEGAAAKRAEMEADAAIKRNEMIAKEKDDYIKDQEAKLGSDWKYTEEGLRTYREYFAAKLGMYQKDSDDYKEIQRQMWAFEKSVTDKETADAERAAAEKEAARKAAAARAKAAAKAAEDAANRAANAITSYSDKQAEAQMSDIEKINLKYDKEKTLLLNNLETFKKNSKDKAKIAEMEEAVNAALIKAEENKQAEIEKIQEAARQKEEAEREKSRDKALKDAQDNAKAAYNAAKTQFELGNDNTDYGLLWETLMGDDTSFSKLESDIQTKAKELMFNVQNEITKLNADNDALQGAISGETDSDKRAELERQLEENKNLILLKQKELNDGLQQLYEEDTEAKKAAQQKKLQDFYQYQQASLNAAATALNGIMAFYDENSEEYKKLKIAETVVSTISGAAGAVATAIAQMGPLAGGIIGGIAAAGIIASGTAAIIKMKKKNPSLSDASSSSSTTASVPSVTQAQPYTYTRNLQTSEEQDLLNQPTKVYVLESDITDAQNTVKAKVVETSF